MGIKIRVVDKLIYKVVASMLVRRSEYEEYKLVVGDTLPTLEFELINDDETPFNTTGCTFKFYFRKYGDVAVKNAGHETCTVTDIANGKVKYEWQTGDLSVEGAHYGELELTKAGKSLTIGRSLRFDIRDQLE